MNTPPTTVKVDKHPLLHNVLSNATWLGKDHFPSREEFADEAEKWLNFASQHGRWPQYRPRLVGGTCASRDETLKELAVGFFLEEIAQTPICEWEPKGADGTPGEYLCKSGETLIFCEVKSPGWEWSFIREQGKHTPRLKQPKHIHAEARTVGNTDDLWYCVEKAYPAMPNDKATLLVIADDLWFPLRLDDLTIDRVLHYPPDALPYSEPPRPGCFTSTAFDRLGAIAFFDEHLSVETGAFEYQFKIFPNPFCLSTVRLPEIFISRWRGICSFCTESEPAKFKQ